jgi:hypothetical protein
MKIGFDEILFFIILLIKILLIIILKSQEKKNRTKTNSGTRVENTLMRNKNIEGTRQIYSVT